MALNTVKELIFVNNNQHIAKTWFSKCIICIFSSKICSLQTFFFLERNRNIVTYAYFSVS